MPADSMQRAFLGIDCGTQSTKALLLAAESDEVLAVGRAAHELIEAADGTREQHPDWWVEAASEAIGGAIADTGELEVAGIGVSGQQHGLVCLGVDDRPVRAAKLWNDTTTADECSLLTDALGGADAVLRLTGNLFLPGYTAPKVAWLRRHEPDAYRASRRFCLPHDYLNLWLTGSYLTEPGDASGTAYFSVAQREYAPAVLAALDPDRDWEATLPEVVPSLSLVGDLRESVAERLSLPAGIPVSAGGGDNMCAAIGTGAISEGRVVMSLGTSGTVFARSEAPAIDPRGEASAFCDSAGAWLPLATTLNCTNATEWARRLFGMDRAGFEKAVESGRPGADGLTFLPYLDGERTPNLPAAAGRFEGLRTSHGPTQVVRAVVEGVTFGMAYALGALRRTGVRPSEILLTGGGAASDAWGQLCADAVGLPVHRAEQGEAAALGAARQARAVVDRTPLGTEAAVTRSWKPDPAPELREAAERAARLRATALTGRA